MTSVGIVSELRCIQLVYIFLIQYTRLLSTQCSTITCKTLLLLVHSEAWLLQDNRVPDWLHLRRNSIHKGDDYDFQYCKCSKRLTEHAKDTNTPQQQGSGTVKVALCQPRFYLRFWRRGDIRPPTMTPQDSLIVVAPNRGFWNCSAFTISRAHFFVPQFLPPPPKLEIPRWQVLKMD